MKLRVEIASFLLDKKGGHERRRLGLGGEESRKGGDSRDLHPPPAPHDTDIKDLPPEQRVSQWCGGFLKDPREEWVSGCDGLLVFKE